MTARIIAMPAPRNRKPSDLDKQIGQAIRDRRDERGMSQSELARAIGVTFQQVQKYERGVNRVAASTLIRIAAALGTTASAFMATLEVDPRTGRPIGDHGSAQDALDFIVESAGEIAPGEETIFLRAWQTGDLDEWPGFYAWLAKRETRQ